MLSLSLGERPGPDREQTMHPLRRFSRVCSAKPTNNWSEREDLNLRPLVSQTSALTGLRHAPNVVPLARIAGLRKARSHHFAASAETPRNWPKAEEIRR